MCGESLRYCVRTEKTNEPPAPISTKTALIGGSLANKQRKQYITICFIDLFL